MSLIKIVNDLKNMLIILIIMYVVLAQGVDLNRCRSRMLIVINATNASARVFRIALFSSSITTQRTLIIHIDVSKRICLILRLINLNPHDHFRVFRQLNKFVLDLGTRSFSRTVRNLLVQVLNEVNEKVKNAHKSFRAKAGLMGSRFSMKFKDSKIDVSKTVGKKKTFEKPLDQKEQQERSYKN